MHETKPETSGAENTGRVVEMHLLVRRLQESFK